MKKNVILLISATFLSKIIAFGKELILAYYYGAGNVSDIYLMALTVPVVIFGFFSTGIAAGFVPAYKKATDNKADKQAGNRFTNEVVAVLLILFSVLIALYFPFNRFIVDGLAKGFGDSEKELTIQFANIMVFAIIFSCITTVMTSYLQANEKTSVIGLLSIPLNIILAISIVLSATCENTIILPYGYLIACIVQTAIFTVISRKNGYRISKDISLWNDNVRFFLSSILILTIGSSVNQINVLVDKMIASTVSVGGISSLEYGNRIIDLISGVFIISISTVQFPRFVNFNNDKNKLSDSFQEGIEGLAITLIPFSFTLLFYPKEIITLVYARGAFGNEAIELTSPILVYYGIGLIAIGVRELISKLYYAIGDMKTPVVNAVIGVGLNVVLNFILVNHLGLGGLALATSITAIIVSISLYIYIREKIIIKIKGLMYLKVMFLSVASTIIGKVIIKSEMFHSCQINIIVGFIGFAFVYLVFGALIGIFDVNTIKRIIKAPR